MTPRKSDPHFSQLVDKMPSPVPLLGRSRRQRTAAQSKAQISTMMGPQGEAPVEMTAATTNATMRNDSDVRLGDRF